MPRSCKGSDAMQHRCCECMDALHLNACSSAALANEENAGHTCWGPDARRSSILLSKLRCSLRALHTLKTCTDQDTLNRCLYVHVQFVNIHAHRTQAHISCQDTQHQRTSRVTHTQRRHTQHSTLCGRQPSLWVGNRSTQGLIQALQQPLALAADQSSAW